MTPPQCSHRADELGRPILQFDAKPLATSIPFFVSGTEFLSLNREIDPDMRRGREASPMRRRCGWLHYGARDQTAPSESDVRFAARNGLKSDIAPCPFRADTVEKVLFD